ncbi:MAG: nickel pincer cofactor biosynthesis protein LarC [Lachnospiraceae bacterium]
MKTLYLDCGMGAAGDMLGAALLELIPDKEEFIDKLNKLGIPGVTYSCETSKKCGIMGTHITVKVKGEEEYESEDAMEDYFRHETAHRHGSGHTHNHEKNVNDGQNQKHENSHEHIHPHGSMHEIEHIVEKLPVSEKVKTHILAVYSLIAEAESHVHGVPVSEIHFHEVGTLDAVADITAVCMLMEQLSPGQVVVSPIHVGSGHVKCAHGILPVPAPATAYILRDVPVYGGEIKSELCTPTGAALLKYFASEFGNMPVMKTTAIGYGMGKKDFAVANCVRAMLGETEDSEDTIIELKCNLDDMTAEALAFAEEQLLTEGALDVYSTATQMKKSRPGIMLSVMCRPEDKDRMVRLIFRHTTTLGVRENISHRYTLSRTIQTVSTEFGDIRKKVSTGYGVTRVKYEYEDIARMAREQHMSIADVTDTLKEKEKTEKGIVKKG